METPTGFEIFYYVITGGAMAAWIAAVMQKRRAALWFGWAVFATGMAACLTIGFAADRPPIYGRFEIIFQITTILSLFALIYSRARYPGKNASGIVIGIRTVSLLLLGVLFFFPKTLNADFYMYNRLSVLSFFNFRISAAALFLMGAVCFCTDIFTSDENGLIHRPVVEGRRLLLIGAICFLISECAGSYWCLNWYGDSWHWSRNFLEASGAFMAVMLAFHLPQGWNLPKPVRAATGCLPAMVSLWLLLI